MAMNIDYIMSWLKVFSTPKCSECGSTHLSWYSGIRLPKNASNGSLRVEEITPIFYLGCDNCSETLKTIESSDVALLLMGVQY